METSKVLPKAFVNWRELLEFCLKQHPHFMRMEFIEVRDEPTIQRFNSSLDRNDMYGLRNRPEEVLVYFYEPKQIVINALGYIDSLALTPEQNDIPFLIHALRFAAYSVKDEDKNRIQKHIDLLAYIDKRIQDENDRRPF